MALPATDSFTNANGTQLPTHNAKWVTNYSDNTNFVINTNQISAAGPAWLTAFHWNEAGFNANQYAKLTITSRSAAWIGLALRCHASDETYYACYSDETTGVVVAKVVAGDYTSLAFSATPFALNSRITFEVVGHSLRTYRDGVIDADLNCTDTAITSGFPGLSCADTSTSARGDLWEGGNVAVQIAGGATSGAVVGAPQGSGHTKMMPRWLRARRRR